MSIAYAHHARTLAVLALAVGIVAGVVAWTETRRAITRAVETIGRTS